MRFRTEFSQRIEVVACGVEVDVCRGVAVDFLREVRVYAQEFSAVSGIRGLGGLGFERG